MKKISRIILGILMLGMAACSSDGGNDVARFRFLQASADTGPVDVYADGALTFENIAFGSSTDYDFTSAGNISFDINLAGTNSQIVMEDADFEQDADYTVLITGFAGDLDGVTYRDDNSFPEPGNAKLRIIHAAPSAPNVDVYVTAADVDINAVAPSVSDLSFKDDSDYLQFAAGNYRIRVTAAGSKVPVIDVLSVLVAGTVHTGVALDAPFGGEPFSLAILDDEV